MSLPIVVINPTRAVAVTAAIDAALAPLRIRGGPPIICQTLAEGPLVIEDQGDVEAVLQPLCRSIAAQDAATGAFVIGSFHDPGLYSARIATPKPVLGSAECGILTALTLGYRFGVISLDEASGPRNRSYIARLGVASRFAGDLAIGLRARELSDEHAVLARMTEVGLALRDEHGADAIVIGCAGMARYRAELEMAVRLAVVEPTVAAVVMALGRVRLGWGVAVHYLASSRSSSGLSSVSTR